MGFYQLTIEILLEDRMEFLRTKYKEKVTDEEFEQLVNTDPTRNKEYLQWIISRYLKLRHREKLRFISEDWGKLEDDLRFYDRIKVKLSLQNRNIMNIKDFVELYNIIDPYRKEEEDKDTGEARKEIEKVYEDSNYLVLIPKTEEAACVYGKGTRWCTASRKNNFFERYNEEGPLFIIIHKKEKDSQGRQEKYQFHFESDQFNDNTNNEIDLKKYIKDNEPVIDAIAKWIIKNEPEKKHAKKLIVLGKEDLFDGNWWDIIDETYDIGLVAKLYKQRKISLEQLNEFNDDASLMFTNNGVQVIYEDWDDEYLIDLFDKGFRSFAKDMFSGDIDLNFDFDYQIDSIINFRVWYKISDKAIEKIRNKILDILEDEIDEEEKDEIKNMNIGELGTLIDDNDNLEELNNEIKIAFNEASGDADMDAYWKGYTGLVKDFFSSEYEFINNKLVFEISYDKFHNWVNLIKEEDYFGYNDKISGVFFVKWISMMINEGDLLYPREQYYGSVTSEMLSERILDRINFM